MKQPVFMRLGQDFPEREIGEVFADDHSGVMAAMADLLREAANELDRLRAAQTVLGHVSAADVMEHLSDLDRRRN